MENLFAFLNIEKTLCVKKLPKTKRFINMYYARKCNRFYENCVEQNETQTKHALALSVYMS